VWPDSTSEQLNLYRKAIQFLIGFTVLVATIANLGPEKARERLERFKREQARALKLIES